MAVLNLSRNTKVYFSTVNTANNGYTDSNTFEIQVMSGYSFAQGTEQETIQITEAGATPNRTQRSFNTKLNPVDWSITTYIRPKKVAAATAVTAAASTGLTGNAGKATFTAAVAHSLVSGDVVTISGATPTAFNRTVPITKINTTVFTYEVSTASGTGTAAGTITATKIARVTCPERHLWNALVGTLDIYNLSNTANPAWVEGTAAATLSLTQSDAHTLAPFALIFKVDNTFYKVKNSAINQAQLSFGLDQIAQIAWSGMGTVYEEISDLTGITELGALTPADSTPNFITNKLSTVRLYAGLNSTLGTSYTLPITGGDLTIANNLTYLTPEILGTVNQSIGYFTGTRAVSGNLNAYLRTGAGNYSGQLLKDVLTTSQTTPETKFTAILEIGGGANATRMDFTMMACMLQVPTVDIQDVVSTAIGFTAQKYTTTNYDMEATPNEFALAYYSA